MRRGRSTSITLAITIVFLQFQFYFFWNYPITVGLISLPFVLALLYEIKLKIDFFLVILILVMQSLTVGILNNRIDYLQFLRTFILFTISIVCIAICMGSKLKTLGSQNVKYFEYTYILLTLFSVFQVAFGELFPILNKPFGSFTNYYAIQGTYFGEFARASGFYNEPSYNALISISLVPIFCATLNGKLLTRILSLGMIYALTTYSLAGIVYFMILGLVIATRAKISKRLLMPIYLVFIASTFSYVGTRIESINTSGSSLNFRIIAPFKALKAILPENFFGIPLGSVEQEMFKIGLLNGQNIGTSIDNGIYLFVMYFGATAILLIILTGIVFYRYTITVKNFSALDFLVLGTPIFTLAMTGAVFTPEFVIIESLAIYGTRLFFENKRILRL